MGLPEFLILILSEVLVKTYCNGLFKISGRLKIMIIIKNDQKPEKKNSLKIVI